MTVRLGDIARLIGAEIPEGAADIEIRSLNSLESAAAGDLSFLSNKKYAGFLETTGASAVIVDKDARVSENTVPLRVENSYFAFMKVIELFNSRDVSDIACGIDSDARIHPESVLGDKVSVGPFAFIGPGVRIGDGTVIGPCSVILRDCEIGRNCLFYPNVTIMDGSHIGNDVIIHSGAVIGADGFGFAPFEGRLHKIPQIGIVVIEDGVEIQACACVDRAAFGETVVSRGAKIDNLVQVGHNVKIGPNTVIASQTGISGSTTIGGGVQIGGQAGLSGHLNVGDGASIGAQAGVTKNVPPNETVSGYPARSHAYELKLEASLARLPELIKTVKKQEKRIEELESIVHHFGKKK